MLRTRPSKAKGRPMDEEITSPTGYPLNAPNTPANCAVSHNNNNYNNDNNNTPRLQTRRSKTMNKLMEELEDDDKGVQDFFHGSEDDDEELILFPEDKAEVKPASRFKRLEVFLQSNTFDVLISILLCINLVFLALELQYSGLIQGYRMAFYTSPTIREEHWPGAKIFFDVGYQVFTWLFAAEVFIRICVL
ncbi:unnamed protein product, partial [Polarella glacialis]